MTKGFWTAAAIGADQVVLVVGATPGLPLAEARASH